MPQRSVSLLKKSFVVPQDHELFRNCHASTLVLLPNGERLVAFFGGEREAAGDVAIWLVRGDGENWQPPRRLMAEDGLAHWNPVLMAEGETVWLFYKVGPTVHDWTTRWSVSHDGGQSWSPPEALVPGDPAPRGPVKNKLLAMSNGEWLAPASVETATRWDAFVDISGDRGRSWRRVDIPLEHRAGGTAESGKAIWSGLSEEALWESDPATVFKWDGVIQPSAWEAPAGHIHMLMRSTRGFLYRTDSTDFGRSWTSAYSTELPNNNSGIDLARLNDGTLTLAFNPVTGNWAQRSPLSISLSGDGGEAFERLLDLETQEGEFSYPAIIADGETLHVTYTFNRKNIVYCSVVLR
ncbi:sialidase family protein [Consotaella salsifontis]|uniref:Predicted neuraminidase (Sialidase) n=1 Tax=Consotaella salsifontis TaxID=1365950 RepID=A0A1T4S6Y4_9HYPH|nr:exo-alpha-sialidase [Consotaella salsifontis]SKA23942.1 Predicted neuraminidase (sialidase) [Consotaella salsifontis]